MKLGIPALILLMGSAPLLQGGNELSKAAYKGNVQDIQARLAAGEGVDELDKWGWTPLMWAVYYRYAPAAQCLLEHKANPNLPTAKAYRKIPRNSTPLHICGYYGLEDFAQMLMKAGANPNIPNEAGKTALDYAREFNFPVLVRIMGREKARPESPKAAPPAHPQPESAALKPAPHKKKTTSKKVAPEKSEPPAIK